MNEELIKRCAEEAGMGDGAANAIRLYHARAVEPLERENAELRAQLALLEPFAPFQQEADNADYCEGCGNGDKVPASGYWRCPECDAEWPGEE